MAQVDTIRNILLKNQVITQRTALLDHRIMALPRRIADLKEQGFPIDTIIKVNPHTGQRYAEYSMRKKVTRLDYLQANCVYRIKNMKINPFHLPTFEESKGYFVVDEAPEPGAQLLWVRMAGRPQVICSDNLRGGTFNFEIEYVGGMA